MSSAMSTAQTKVAIVAFQDGTGIYVSHDSKNVLVAQLIANILPTATVTVAFEKPSGIFIKQNGEDVCIAEFNSDITAFTKNEMQLPYWKKIDLMDQKIDWRQAAVNIVNYTLAQQRTHATSQPQNTVRPFSSPPADESQDKTNEASDVAPVTANTSTVIMGSNTTAAEMPPAYQKADGVYVKEGGQEVCLAKFYLPAVTLNFEERQKSERRQLESFLQKYANREAVVDAVNAARGEI